MIGKMAANRLFFGKTESKRSPFEELIASCRALTRQESLTDATKMPQNLFYNLTGGTSSSTSIPDDQDELVETPNSPPEDALNVVVKGYGSSPPSFDVPTEEENDNKQQEPRRPTLPQIVFTKDMLQKCNSDPVKTKRTKPIPSPLKLHPPNSSSKSSPKKRCSSPVSKCTLTLDGYSYMIGEFTNTFLKVIIYGL